ITALTKSPPRIGGSPNGQPGRVLYPIALAGPQGKFGPMIRHFEPAHPLEPEDKPGMQWGAALGAGLIAGVILLVVPRGSPWSSLTVFSPVIMGRALSP